MALMPRRADHLLPSYDPAIVIAEGPEDDTEEVVGEFQVADYLVFLLALDTYMRYAEESSGVDDVEDALIKTGLRLLRVADGQIDALGGFLDGHLGSPAQKTMLKRALALKAFTPIGASRRALQFRTLLSRGGPATMKGIFENQKYVRQVREAISASMLDDADRALDIFASITLRNTRLAAWIDKASEQAGSGTGAPAPVDAASTAGTAETEVIVVQNIQQMGAAGAQEAQQAQENRSAVLDQVERNATEAARKSLEINQQPDEPPVRSEVAGIATAAAVAALSDPSRLQNVPAPLRELDDEQRAAALTEGRVVVAAGAGAGKSKTLVSRIDYLVSDRRVNPARIMACSFNRKAAMELKEKIAGSLGKGSVMGTSGVQVGTMHSLFAKLIVGSRDTPGFGTPEEQAMLRSPRLIAPPSKGEKTVSPASLSQAIRGMWEDCNKDNLVTRYGFKKEWLETPPKAKKANLLLNSWRGNDIGLQGARDSVTSKSEAQGAVWYDMYLGLKGDIPGWRPPCASKSYDNFMGRHRKGGERLGDLDDMLKILRDILVRDPKAKKTIQGMFDHILVDECVHGDTVVDLEGGGARKVRDIKPGDTVRSYFNGAVSFKAVSGVARSKHSTGFKVVTESGAELDMTANHRLYATSPMVAPEGQTYLYLMFRKDLGFRVGVSDRPTRRDPGGSISRACAERADALWVLDLGDRSEMLYQEQALSLTYGIPTQVFEGAVRGLDQSRIDRLFSEYGPRGRALLEARGLDFDYPNWVNDTATTDRVNRLTINVNAHRPVTRGLGGTSITFSWTGNLPNEPDSHVYTVKGGRRMYNRRLNSYVEARKLALQLSALTGGRIRESIEVGNDTCLLVTASAIHPGMSVPVNTSEGVILDKVIAVFASEGDYYDLSVEDSANFFGNGILSHNCQDLNTIQHQIFEMMSEHIASDATNRSIFMIGDDKQSIYQFRGAKPELFKDLYGKEGWTTRMIRTNYRCQPEIVEAANSLIAVDTDRIPMEARADPRKDRGRASIQVTTPEDNVDASINTIGRYRKDIDEGAEPENFAVLARTNAELNDFETACIINEIPYVRRGGKGFLEAPESRAVIGYLDLAAGNDYEKMKKSLVAVLMKPDRNLFLGPDDVAKAVDEALDDVARRERVDIKSIRPDILLEGKYVNVLADKLKQPYRLKIVNMAADPGKGEWMYKKRVEELSTNLKGLASNVRDLRAYVEEDHPTPELISYVLDNMTSRVTGWDRITRREVTETTSLREQITNDVAVFSDDDDDLEEDKETPPGEVGEEGHLPVQTKEEKDKEERKGLGAVQFLYALAQPNSNDQEHLTDPTLSQGFVRKLDRYSKIAETLRIDPIKWEKEQSKIADEGKRKMKPPAITLSTVHSVKGAQWTNVTVLMPKGIFPFEPKRKPDEPEPDPVVEAARLKAERNLAYVALTRAAVNLEVSCPLSSGMSPFVFQAGLQVGENVPKTGQAPEVGGMPTRGEDNPEPVREASVAIADWHPEIA